MGPPRMWPHDVLGALLFAAILSAPRASSATPAGPDAPAPATPTTAPAAAPAATAGTPTAAPAAAPAATTATPTAATAGAPAAEVPATGNPQGNEAPPPTDDPARDLAALKKPPGPTFHFLGTLFFGDGFRFNNPYRLRTQLGESARTVSVTAPYVDFGAALAIGSALGLQHGVALNLTASLAGVGQAALVPAYIAAYRGDSTRWLGFARLGPAILLSPDANVGGELGVGGAAFLTAKVAITAEVVGNLFYGAATRETGFPVYPIVSLQLGLLFGHEVFP